MAKYNRKQRDNRGLSLLEVIIAVAIFSVAALILMQGFVTSARINRKSNLYLEATTTAQNVMEELKAKDFEDIARSFNYPMDYSYSEGGFCRFHFLEQDAMNGLINAENGTMIRELVEDGAGELIPADENTASAYSEDGGKTFTFRPKESGRYAYEILNATNRHETFDVRVSFDGGVGSAYRSGDENAPLKNDFEAPNINRLNEKFNGFMKMPFKWDEKTLEKMIQEQYAWANDEWIKDKVIYNNDPSHQIKHEDGRVEIVPPFESVVPMPDYLDKDEVFKKTKCTLKVTLEENEAAGTIEAKYSYILDAHDYSDPRFTGDGGAYPYATFTKCPGKDNSGIHENCFCTKIIEVEEPFYSAPLADEDGEKILKNLYVFYYPNYDRDADHRDTVEFINAAGYPVNFYLVKMKNPEITEKDELSVKEQGYRMELNIQDSGTPPEGEDYVTKLFTNLGYDISEDDVSERTEVPGQIIGGGHESKSLENPQQKDRIFELRVEVYKQGTDELIVSLNGSKEG